MYEFFTLVEGDCFLPSDEPFEDIDFDSTIEWVDCDSPHQGELYAWTLIPDAAGTAYPGLDTVGEAASDYCLSEFAGYVGSDFDDSFLEYWYYYPTETGWEDRPYFMCAVRDPDGEPLVGTAFGSGW